MWNEVFGDGVDVFMGEIQIGDKLKNKLANSQKECVTFAAAKPPQTRQDKTV